jgi:hypothetical protein
MCVRYCGSTDVTTLLHLLDFWLAGIVTTGAAPFVPVSAIENSSITTPNVDLDSNLPQLRDDLFRLVDLPRHRVLLKSKNHSSGWTTSTGVDQNDATKAEIKATNV